MAAGKGKSSGKSRKQAGSAARTRNVWLSLLGVMTVVGGVLLVVDENRVRRGAGFSIPTAMATSTATSASSIFQTREPLASWSRIVIRQTGKPFAGPEVLDGEGALPAHFVVGNGNGLANGVLHVSRAWMDQEAVGGEAGTVVICVVGSERRGPHTEAQIARLLNLAQQLASRLHIPQERIELQVGSAFSSASFREQLGG